MHVILSQNSWDGGCTVPTVLAFHNISIVEFASGLPCNRTIPDCWSLPQKWTCSAQELPEPSCSLWCLAWFWGHAGGWSTREGHAKELELLQCLSKCGVGRSELHIGSCQACKQPTFPQQHAGFSHHSSAMSAAWCWTQHWWEVKFGVLVLGTPISSGVSSRKHSRTSRTGLSGMAAASQYALKVISSSFCGSMRGPSWDLCYFLKKCVRCKHPMPKSLWSEKEREGMLGDKMSQTWKKKCLGTQTYSVGKPHGEQTSPEFCINDTSLQVLQALQVLSAALREDANPIWWNRMAMV